jgi:hypothetical protein
VLSTWLLLLLLMVRGEELLAVAVDCKVCVELSCWLLPGLGPTPGAPPSSSLCSSWLLQAAAASMGLTPEAQGSQGSAP